MPLCYTKLGLCNTKGAQHYTKETLHYAVGIEGTIKTALHNVLPPLYYTEVVKPYSNLVRFAAKGALC